MGLTTHFTKKKKKTPPPKHYLVYIKPIYFWPKYGRGGGERYFDIQNTPSSYGPLLVGRYSRCSKSGSLGT